MGSGFVCLICRGRCSEHVWSKWKDAGLRPWLGGLIQWWERRCERCSASEGCGENIVSPAGFPRN